MNVVQQGGLAVLRGWRGWRGSVPSGVLYPPSINVRGEGKPCAYWRWQRGRDTVLFDMSSGSRLLLFYSPNTAASDGILVVRLFAKQPLVQCE